MGLLVQGIRNLLSWLGARPGGSCHVVITDVREELAVYVNGRPYLRRELDMPSAALHHAGAPHTWQHTPAKYDTRGLKLALKSFIAVPPSSG